MDYEKLKKIMLEQDSQAITIDEGKYCVSDEWLVGTLVGAAFIADTEDDAIKRMCDYFDENANNQSIVGDIITNSGWPNLDDVENYLSTPEMSGYEKKINEGVILSEGWLEDLLRAIQKEERTGSLNGNEPQVRAIGMRNALEIIKDHI